MAPRNPSTVAETKQQRPPRVPAVQRRAEILTTAARLFQHWGYTGVGIDEIGAEIGISGPAIYRHFKGKEALLAEISGNCLDELCTIARTTSTDSQPTEEALRELISSTVIFAFDHVAEITTVLRHMTHLQRSQHQSVLDRWHELVDLWLPYVTAARPNIAGTEASLYIRAACGLVIGAARSDRKLPRTRTREILTTMVLSLLEVEIPPTAMAASETIDAVEGGWIRASSRERVLAHAITLFRQRGFKGVSMSDIAEAIGLTPAAPYRHFDSKEAILVTAIERAGQRGGFAITDALASARSADEALNGLLRAYVGVAVDHKDLIAVAISEYRHVPQVKALRREQIRLRNDEWLLCLASTRPDLSQPEATLVVEAVIGMINECVRSRRVGARTTLRSELHQFGCAALTAC